MKKTFLVIGAFGFVMLYLVSPSAFGLMVGLGTDELTRQAEVVIVGEVEELQSQWSKDGKSIITDVFITVGDVIRGEPPEAHIKLEHKGGQIGDITLKVSDEPAFQRGEKVLLFLKSKTGNVDGIRYRVVGKGQGKYTIAEDGSATKGNVTLMDGNGEIDDCLSVDELIQKIRGVQ